VEELKEDDSADQREATERDEPNGTDDSLPKGANKEEEEEKEDDSLRLPAGREDSVVKSE